jgi:hypothetical protein
MDLASRTKQAFEPLTELMRLAGGATWGLGNLAAVGVPLAGGVALGGGYLAGRASRRPEQDDDIQQLKKRVRNEELASLFRMEAEKARQKAKYKKYRESKPTPPRQPQLF